MEVKGTVGGGGVVNESILVVVVGRRKERSDSDKRENRVEEGGREEEVFMAELEEVLIGEGRDFLTDVKRIRTTNQMLREFK